MHMLHQSFRRNFLQHALAVSTWVQEHDPRTMGDGAFGGRSTLEALFVKVP
jgi:hypothetical protein